MHRALIPALIAALIVPQGAWAQQPAEPQPPRPSNLLKIYVLQGDGAINSTSARLATSPTIEVRDANDFPAAGATVTFELPASGPSASFEGGKLLFSSVTDSRGQVSAALITPNNQTGTFVIKVSARLGDRTGIATLRQTNSTKEFSAVGKLAKKQSFLSRNKWWIMGVGLGAAGGLGYYLATRSNSSTSGSILVPGTPTVGGPQ